MKGVIFTEFLALVEAQFGLAICDRMLAQADSDGIYTAVGSYDHRELVKMVVILGRITDTPIEALQQFYGKVLFQQLIKNYPEMAGVASDCFQFIQQVEATIHLEVMKLYPDAQPPRFTFDHISEQSMILRYHSSRCLGHVCYGLIEGCAEHFDERVSIVMTPVTSDLSEVRFELTKVEHAL
ncbi:hypothetical protein VST7929_02744 [Vibrio stylophorae]|uniref:Heme NO-binding domain-containing protein n=1 Tax=Vibrio stylophorae TaxID=659351 RepID=A0ABN8DVH7_9VIBR|nr:heme NO-binding domain-containing protein [Vibrio stylophorae]CAH0535083.1 hypothetical protein VST7929_02744 [Vibrio stylophorae]